MAESWDDTPINNGTQALPTRGFGRGFGRGVLQEIRNETNNNSDKPGGLSKGFDSKAKSNGFGNTDENSGVISNGGNSFRSNGGFGGQRDGGFGGGGFRNSNGNNRGFKRGEDGGQPSGRGSFNKCDEEGNISSEFTNSGGKSDGGGFGGKSGGFRSGGNSGGFRSGGNSGGFGRGSGGFGDDGGSSGSFGGGGFGRGISEGGFRGGNSSGFGGGNPKGFAKSAGDSGGGFGDSRGMSRENAGGRGDFSTRKGCFKCGEEGHMSRECPNAQQRDGEKREIYVPPEPSNVESEIFANYEKGINFDKYDSIPVEVSGRSPVSFISSFDEAGLRDVFLRNVRKAKYEKPTPVQKYAIPIVIAGRDLMACAQTGSGKTAAFVLPVITGMMQEGLQSSQFSEVQQPQSITIAPTRELANQIYQEARKFSYGTDLRCVVLYGGTSVQYQARAVRQGAHFVVGTPGRLLDFVGKGIISLEKVKYLILDEADRMLDMGFETDVRKLVETMGMPSKTERQTLMFSATFPEEIQKLAGDFLNDYLFVTVGRVGGANSDVEQLFFEIDRLEKREKLCSILTDAGTEKTLVFVDQKRNADFLALYLSQSGFPTTSIHGDRLQREREEALADFKSGKAPILIATNVAARGLDIAGVKHVINYDLPQSVDEYVHRIGRTGRCGNIGRATSFYSHDTDSGLSKSLVRILYEANQGVPSWLESYAATSAEVPGGHRMGGRFGGKDIRRGHGGKSGGNQGNANAWFDGGGQQGGNSASAGGDEEEWD